jgi:hypothetical protein
MVENVYDEYDKPVNIGGETLFKGADYQINASILLLIRHFYELKNMSFEVFNDIELRLNNGTEISVQVKREHLTKTTIPLYIKNYCKKNKNVFVVKSCNADIIRLIEKIEQYNNKLEEDKENKISIIKQIKSFLKKYNLNDSYEKVLNLEILVENDKNLDNTLYVNLQKLFNCNINDASNIYEKLYTRFSKASKDREILNADIIKKLIEDTNYNEIKKIEELIKNNKNTTKNEVNELKKFLQDLQNKISDINNKSLQEKTIELIENDKKLKVILNFYENDLLEDAIAEIEKIGYYEDRRQLFLLIFLYFKKNDMKEVYRHSLIMESYEEDLKSINVDYILYYWYKLMKLISMHLIRNDKSNIKFKEKCIKETVELLKTTKNNEIKIISEVLESENNGLRFIDLLYMNLLHFKLSHSELVYDDLMNCLNEWVDSSGNYNEISLYLHLRINRIFDKYNEEEALHDLEFIYKHVDINKSPLFLRELLALTVNSYLFSNIGYKYKKDESCINEMEVTIKSIREVVDCINKLKLKIDQVEDNIYLYFNFKLIDNKILVDEFYYKNKNGLIPMENVVIKL